LEMFQFFSGKEEGKNYKFPISKEEIIERSEFVKKMIFRILLDTDSSMVKYKHLIAHTSFCEKVFEKLSNFSEEMISYPLSSFLIIMSDQDKSYIAEREIRSILKSLGDCFNEEKMKIILKNLKSFIDMSINNH